MPKSIAVISFAFGEVDPEGMVAAKLALLLCTRGYSVTVYCAKMAPLLYAGVDVEGVRIRRVEYRETPGSPEATSIILRIWALITGARKSEHEWAMAVRDAFVTDGADRSYNYVFSRSNPFVSHLAARLIVKTQSDIKWIGYYSDPWPEHLLIGPYAVRRSFLRKLRNTAVLVSHLSAMCAVVYPSKHQMAHVLGYLHGYSRGKSHAIPHLPTWWLPLTTMGGRGDEALRLCYTGSISRFRRLDGLYGALDIIMHDDPGLYSRLSIEFSGGFGYNDIPSKHANVVKYAGTCSLEEACQRQVNADVVLIVEADLETGIFMPSKLADALYFNSVMLALSPSVGVVADLCAEYSSYGQTLVMAPPLDSHAIAEAIKKLYLHKQTNSLRMLRPPEQLRVAYGPDRILSDYESVMNNSCT